jgi:hypothetical protein
VIKEEDKRHVYETTVKFQCMTKDVTDGKLGFEETREFAFNFKSEENPSRRVEKMIRIIQSSLENE